MACEVEAAYIQPPECRPDPTIPVAEGMPVIDLSPMDSGDPVAMEKLAEEVRDALKEWCIFYVVNHGISTDVRENIDKNIYEFFGLPLEEKLKVQRTLEDPLGYVPTDLTWNTKDWIEIYEYFMHSPLEIPANPEPDCSETITLKNKPPENPQGFLDACIAYGKEAEKLAHKILELIALSLGLPAKRFVPFFEGKNMTFNRINYYRPCPNPELVLGKGCHTDTSSVTVVATNDVSGLEIKTREGTFLKVNPLPGSYIINLGEAMNVWSNGYYESSDHRAVAPKDRHRFSMAFSLGPAPDMMVEPLEELINEDHPRRFTGFKYGKFWRSRRHTSLLRLKEQNIRARHFKIRE